MNYEAQDLVAASYYLIHPTSPVEWIRRAAEETVRWSDMNPNATYEQEQAHKARIWNMCTTGEW